MSGKVRSGGNIDKLRLLVEELEVVDMDSSGYKDKLNDIKSLVNEEIKLISKLKRPDNKLKHYESICTGILSIISEINL